MKADYRENQAESSDRHRLYQESVQDVEAEIEFVSNTYRELRGRDAILLREDFCGTANTACEWICRSPDHHAIAIDHDAAVLAWGRANNLARLSGDEQRRIELLQQNAATAETQPADIILAMNFSYYLFLSRRELRNYFVNTLQGLAADGILFLDAYGGYEAPMEIEETRECDGFTYIWEQASFNPINSQMVCHIHFDFADGSRMERAFSYHWRLWTLPEIREILYEAGYTRVDIYWEGTDESGEEGNGVYEPAEIGTADPGWICYIVAEK